MDSTAYAYFIDEFRERLGRAAGLLPYTFTVPRPESTHALHPDLALFLDQLRSGMPPAPPLLGGDDSWFLPALVRTMHCRLAALLRAGTGRDTVDSRDFTELVRLLIDCACPRHAHGFDRGDPVSLAMTVFLLEAGMHFGWCPNAAEPYAKRAAHIGFNHLKKNLYQADEASTTVIYGYVLGAWIMAQKTEGIQDRRLENESSDVIREYSWKEDGSDACCGYLAHQTGCGRFFALFHSATMPGHPVRLLGNAGSTGLSFVINGQPAVRTALTPLTRIDRRDIIGCRFRSAITVDDQPQFELITAVQLFRDTLYRIDVLQPFPSFTPLLQEVTMTMECDGVPRQVATGRFGVPGGEPTVICFQENPFAFVCDGASGGTAVFAAGKRPFALSGTTQIVTAWTLGRETVEISGTNLLGIFDR